MKIFWVLGECLTWGELSDPGGGWWCLPRGGGVLPGGCLPGGGVSDPGGVCLEGGGGV